MSGKESTLAAGAGEEREQSWLFVGHGTNSSKLFSIFIFIFIFILISTAQGI